MISHIEVNGKTWTVDKSDVQISEGRVRFKYKTKEGKQLEFDAPYAGVSIVNEEGTVDEYWGNRNK